MGLLRELLTSQIIEAAIDVHRTLGPGLLESAYTRCLAQELSILKVPFEREVDLPVTYKGTTLDCGYRMDLVVDRAVVVEVKAVADVVPIDEAQLLTYLRLSGHRVGPLINFHTKVLKDGVLRRVL